MDCDERIKIFFATGSPPPKKKIISLANQIIRQGVRTIVLQSGDDFGFSQEILSEIIKKIKKENSRVAITLSIGERPFDNYKVFKDAGADRYLSKHETANPRPYERFHPGQTLKKRLEILEYLKKLDYQIGAGNIVGLPYQTLKETSHMLKEEKELLKKVNQVLSSVNKEYSGNTKVKHIAEVLHKEIGTSKISSMVKKPLHNLKVAAFYGCHLIRPSEVMKFDDPENPKILDELIEAIGCISVPRMQKMLCCGAPLLGVNMELSLEMAKNNLDYIKSSGADCIVTLCPFCQTQFDRNQAVIQRKFNLDYNLPSFYYAELLSLALGVEPEKLGFNLHRVKVEPILEKIL